MKKFSAVVLCVALFCTLLCTAVSASTQSSDFFRRYEGTLYEGNSCGTLQVTLNANTYDSVNSLGVSQIRVYKSNGTYVKTITGTYANGLLSSGRTYSNTYTISAVAGEHYYLELTFIARDSSGSDYKTYTTNTAMAAA